MNREIARRVLKIEADAITDLASRVDERFDAAVEILLLCQGRVVVTGMGKSGLIGRKIAATFSSTGTPAVFLHPAEALHGDLGVLVRGDVLLAISYSGDTEEIIGLLGRTKRLGIRIVTMTGNLRSPLACASEVAIDISVREEACSLNLAPTASTTAALAMGDALAIALLDRRGFQEEDFADLHPSGRLGKKLQRVEDMMHVSERLPVVHPDTPITDVIYEIGRKGLGMTTVVDGENRLVGVITDGDLRRLMQQRKSEALDLTAAECMTVRPVTIAPGEFAGAALRLMEERKITSVVVVGERQRLEGVVHLHDLWTLELF